MATTTFVPIEEYLRSNYEPDAEYVDGEIEERAMGEEQHSNWQAALVLFFGMRRNEWGIRVRPELRTRTGDRRYRIPDIAILDRDAPRDSVALVAPLAAFEILSPEDRLARLIVRLADFEAMGVKLIYVIDPADNSILRFQQGRFTQVEAIAFRDSVIQTSELIGMLD